MSSAPHLPDKKENESTTSLGWFFLIVLLSGLAGMASALATEAWLTPTITGLSTNRISIQSKTNQSKKLDSLTKEQVEQRTVKVYKKEEKIQNKYYKDNFLAKAALLSSDGWAVMYYPEYVQGSFRRLEAMDSQGVVHEVESAVYDQQSKLVYLNLKGDNFRVSSIVDWNQVNANQPVWLYDQEWQKEKLGSKQKVVSSEVISLTTPIYKYSFIRSYKQGTPIINKQGELIGFIGSENNIIPAWYISSQMNNVLSEQLVNYDFPELKGIIINDVVAEKNRTKSLNGVYITKSESRKIRPGEIITKINGQEIDKKELAQTALSAEKPITITILREEETETITLTKNN